MKVKNIEFRLSDTAVTRGSPIRADLVMHLNASKFRVENNNIYKGNEYQGRIEPTTVIVGADTPLETFCRTYNPQE
jgi:hypothetical protein